MKNSEKGFSYVDVMIAIVILMIGVLGALSAISASIVRGKGQEQQITAKQIATSTMEAIMSAKETNPDRLGWKTVGNIGSNFDEFGVPHGVFVTGTNAVLSAPGPDQLVGTIDDTGTPVVGFRREIVIGDICDPDRPSYNCPTPGTFEVKMRVIDVRVFYYIGQVEFSERVRTVLTQYIAEN